MKNLMWLNAAAFALYLFFGLAVFVFDLYVLPNWGAFQPPPAQVGIAIEQGSDIEALRAVAQLLFDHVTSQAREINSLIGTGLFWIRLHLFGALTLACINFAWLFRLRKQARLI